MLRASRWLLTFLAMGALPAGEVGAQAAVPAGPAKPSSGIWLRVAGFATGLAAHEAGHLAFDHAFGADPYIKRVELGGIPFFAVAQRSPVSARQELIISAAGFWIQELGNEWLLSSSPDFCGKASAFKQGIFAFNVLASVGYAGVAFLRTGPPERDTRSIADAVDADERVIGAAILAPALLDTYRCFRPTAGWAKWTSRAVKLVPAILAFR